MCLFCPVREVNEDGGLNIVFTLIGGYDIRLIVFLLVKKMVTISQTQMTPSSLTALHYRSVDSHFVGLSYVRCRWGPLWFSSPSSGHVRWTAWTVKCWWISGIYCKCQRSSEPQLGVDLSPGLCQIHVVSNDDVRRWRNAAKCHTGVLWSGDWFSIIPRNCDTPEG